MRRGVSIGKLLLTVALILSLSSFAAFANEESSIFTTEKDDGTYVCIPEDQFRETTADLRTLEYFENEFIPSLQDIITEKETIAQGAVEEAEQAIQSRNVWRGAAIAGGIGLIISITLHILVTP